MSQIPTPHNKRTQTDHPTRYARGLAADARRYILLPMHLRILLFTTILFSFSATGGPVEEMEAYKKDFLYWKNLNHSDSYTALPNLIEKRDSMFRSVVQKLKTTDDSEEFAALLNEATNIQKNFDPDWDYQYFNDLARVYLEKEKMFENYFSEYKNEWLITGLIFVVEENDYENSNNADYTSLRAIYEKTKGSI